LNTTNIFIARHGETEYNRLDRMQGRGIDQPLNKTGRMQAKAIADYLSDKAVDHIIASSLRRSMETAEIISWMFRKEYRYYKELDEMDFGELEGRPVEEIQSELNEIHEKWRRGDITHAPEGGESPSEVAGRVRNKINQILEEHFGSNILLILHGRLIRILLSGWLDYGLENMHRVPHTNGALYYFKLRKDTFEPQYLNKTDHLKETENIGQ